MVAGPDTGPVVVPPEPGQWFAGLRFLPGKAPGFLGVPASELLDSRVRLEDLWGAAATARLVDLLAAGASPADAAVRPGLTGRRAGPLRAGGRSDRRPPGRHPRQATRRPRRCPARQPRPVRGRTPPAPALPCRGRLRPEDARARAALPAGQAAGPRHPLAGHGRGARRIRRPSAPDPRVPPPGGNHAVRSVQDDAARRSLAWAAWKRTSPQHETSSAARAGCSSAGCSPPATRAHPRLASPTYCAATATTTAASGTVSNRTRGARRACPSTSRSRSRPWSTAGATDEQLVSGACDYLAKVAAEADAGGAVPPAFPVIEGYPRAAHWTAWTYEPGLNPTAGLVGLLRQLGAKHPWIDEADGVVLGPDRARRAARPTRTR